MSRNIARPPRVSAATEAFKDRGRVEDPDAPARIAAIMLVGEAYWRRAVDFDFLLDEGGIAREDRALFWFAETAEEIWRGILHWHEAAGEPPCGAE